MKIKLTYYWKLFWIKDRLYERLTRLWISKVLIKLAYRVSPDAEKAIEAMAVQKYRDELWG